MKQCPVCKSTFTDATLQFCMSDGVALIDLGGGQSNVSGNPQISTEETVVMPSGGQVRVTVPEETVQTQQRPATQRGGMGLGLKILLAVGVLGILGVIVVAAGVFVYFNMSKSGKVTTSVSSSNSSSSTPSSSSNTSSSSWAEKPKITSEQQAIIDASTETKWDDQGLSWKLPAGWKKMDVSKESFNYQAPDNAVLLVNISDLGDSFPMDISLKAYYDQAMQQLRNGKYESVKIIELDGLSGVEFTEAPPPGKDDARRHQWIGYRRYLGQVQQLNVMTSTRAANFAKHLDDFSAILYSMRANK